MKKDLKAMLAAIATYTIFGLSFLFSKMALEFAEPSLLLWARFTVTFLTLNLLWLARVGKLSLRGKHIGRALLLGLLQPILYFVFENYGLKYTTAAFTGIVSSISPVLTVILGAVLLREKVLKKQWLCVALTVIGVLIISLSGSSGGSGTIAGSLCLLAAYTFGSLYTVLARKISDEFTPFELTYVMFALGFVFFSGLAFSQYGTGLIPALTNAFAHPTFLIGVLYLGILSSVVAFLLVNYSLANLPVARATSFGSLSTVVSVVFGVLLLHDPFSWLQAAASVLILAGVWGVNRFRQQ